MTESNLFTHLMLYTGQYIITTLFIPPTTLNVKIKRELPHWYVLLHFQRQLCLYIQLPWHECVELPLELLHCPLWVAKRINPWKAKRPSSINVLSYLIYWPYTFVFFVAKWYLSATMFSVINYGMEWCANWWKKCDMVEKYF